jgi:undecaprenyl-diphosphatase
MAYLLIIFLGVVQGIAEFLPISSSGHLVVIAALLEQVGGQKLPDFVELNIVLHGGTLASILVVYWRRILKIITVDRRVIGLVIVGTLPAIVIGLPLHEIDALSIFLKDPLLVGCLLPVTGALLLFATRHTSGEIDLDHMTYRQALLVGLAQAIAILPGISRSGATIVAGLCLGLRPATAATFSFLLAIVAIAGAVTLELKDLVGGHSSGPGAPVGPLLAGTFVAFVVGIFALKLLLSWLERGRLQPFAYWCFAVGAAVIVWQLSV